MKKEKHGGNIYNFDRKMYDFSANLNPLGMPEEIRKAVADHIDEYSAYPDPYSRRLKKAISDQHGVNQENIAVGNGGADLIYRTALFLKIKKALLLTPCFVEYEDAVKSAGGTVLCRQLKEAEDFALDEEKFLREFEESEEYKDVDAVFIASPNNPTGRPVSREFLINMSKACKNKACKDKECVLIVDEAFADFLDMEEKYSVTDIIEQLDNTIAIRSFTKMYAMAGLRLGYAVCSDKGLAKRLGSCLQSWPVSAPAEVAGCTAFSLNGFVDNTRDFVREERKYLVENLKAAGIKVFGGSVNYIFFKSEIADLREKLIEEGIIIRDCSNYRGLKEGYYRIAVRSREENRYLVSAFGRITRKED